MQSSPRKIVEEGLLFYERIQKSFSSLGVLATTGVEFSQLLTKGLERLEALLFKTTRFQGSVCLTH